MQPLIENMGFFILIPILFLVVGFIMAVHILGGLITGGPRALERPGAPHLYDHIYYLIFLVAGIGWAGALLSVPNASDDHPVQSGFLLGWGLMAIGIGSLLLWRFDMMLDAARYRAEHGNFLIRLYYRIQVRQMERLPQWQRKLMSAVFIAAGIGVIAFNIQNVGEALDGVTNGARLVAQAFTTH